MEEPKTEEDVFATEMKRQDCVRKDGGDKCITCDYGKQGRCINYSRNNVLYQQMNDYDRANYGVYMMNFNVERNAEFAGGLSDVRTAGKDWQSLVGFHLIRRPQKLINFATFAAFAMIIILFVILIIMLILTLFFKLIRLITSVEIEIPRVKRVVLFWMIIALVLVGLSLLLIQWVYDRTITRLENIIYIIK